MTEAHSTIEILFGNPSSDSKQERLERAAIELGFSMERMVLYDFEYIFKNYWNKSNGEHVFELMFLYLYRVEVRAPKVAFGTYKDNGSIYPKLVIYDDYWDKVHSDGSVWINDEMIEGLGKEIDAHFDFEYVNFLRVKKL
jgi:hypothetical protein